MAESWYALRSKSQKELTVWHQAEHRGFETFYPYIRVKPVNPRSRRLRPYFPGYMFVKADLSQVGVSTFRFMPYTLGLVSFGTEPAEIPEAIINELRKRMDQIQNEGLKSAMKFSKGDRVRIKDGPFEGYYAIFDHTISGDDRVRVLLEMLANRSVALDLDAAGLEKARQTKS